MVAPRLVVILLDIDHLGGTVIAEYAEARLDEKGRAQIPDQVIMPRSSPTRARFVACSTVQLENYLHTTGCQTIFPDKAKLYGPRLLCNVDMLY
jgi:hypothetical protein